MSSNRQASVARLASDDIPQANRLENIRRLAAAVRDGIQNPAALLELLEVDQRHFAYYRRAAVVLGVVQDLREGGLSVTRVGHDLLATAEGSDEERAEWRRIVTSAPALQPFAELFDSLTPDTGALALQIAGLTGLAGTTALRRASTLIQWKRYIDGSRTTGEGGPDLPEVTSQLEGQVARHNALVKQRYLEWLLRIPPGEFEQLVARLVGAMGYANVRAKGGSGDGGVDVTGDASDQWGAPVRIVVQVKRHERTIGRRVVDELLGVLSREEGAQGVLITTSDFSSQALEAGRNKARLRLVNGPQLVNLLVQNGVELTIGRYGEIVRSGR